MSYMHSFRVHARLLAGCLLAAALGSAASLSGAVIDVPTPTATATATAITWDDQHLPWARTLERIVKNDGVDYRALRRDHADLDLYVAQLAHAPEPGDLPGKLAFYINAYNALTLHVVDSLLPEDDSQWPLWSIVVAGTPPGNVWKGYRFEVAGRRLTLDTIEHEVLRPLGDARIHFAINCASRSCPTLAPVPYRVATINAQLDAAVRTFILDPQQLRLSNETLLVNPILSWFGEDFKTLGGVRAFLRTHAQVSQTTNPRIADPLIAYLSGSAAWQFFAYDWRLNITSAAAESATESHP